MGSIPVFAKKSGDTLEHILPQRLVNLLQPVGALEHFAGFRAVRGADDAVALHQVQDPSGAWLTDQPAHTMFDQTAEIAIWLKEISAELESAILPRQGARSLR